MNKLFILILIILCGCAFAQDNARCWWDTETKLQTPADSCYLYDDTIAVDTVIWEIWEERVIKTEKTVPFVFKGDTFLLDIYKVDTIRTKIY